MDNKIISIDTLRYYNDKISNYVDEKVSDTVDNLELGELNAILVDTDAEADDPIVPDYVTETELNTALSNKMDKVTLAKVATSGSYNDLSNKPTIPSAVTESTVSGWGFTKNPGTYSKPSGGIPKTDLASAVQTSLGKADTALQSYTEQYKGTITGVSANGTSVATSGVANIPAASTSKYGVTKLSSATNSASTTEAATPSAVKAAYDLANSYKGTVTGVKINGTTKNPSSGVVDLGTVITSHQDISGKQDKLVSGTNIKTINGTSILGSGDITISGGSGGSSSGSGAYPEVDGSIYKQEDMLGNWYSTELTPNTFYVFPECGILDVSLGSEMSGVANEYLFQFTSGSEPTTLVLPDDIKWTNELVIEPHIIYQISILKGLASVLAFDNNNTQISIFYIDGIEYQMDEGMTWEEWVNSEYNIAGFYIDYMSWIDTYCIAIGDGMDYGTIPEASPSGLISSGYEYEIYYENGGDEPDGPGSPI